MLYLTCTTISSVDLAQYGVSLAKDWVSVECGTNDEKSSSWVHNTDSAFSIDVIQGQLNAR